MPAGLWTGSVSFNIAPQHPGLCSPVAPAGALTDTRGPQFIWEAADRATWHQVWLNKDRQTYLAKWVGSNTTWTAADLPVGKYSWWVRGWNLEGYGPWSTNADFTIPPLTPGACNPLAPTGTVTGLRRPAFTWTAASRATWYRLWINKAGAKYCDTWVQASTVWTPTLDLPDDSYEWWVRPWNPDGYGAWSVSALFKVHQPLGTYHDFGLNDPNRCVVLGDSISAPEGEQGPYWPTRLSLLLRKEVVNLAVGGEMAEEGAPRTPGVLSEYRPGFLLILYGANDVIRGRLNQNTVDHLRFIVRTAKRNQTIPVLATLTPMTASHAVYDGGVDELNTLIVQMARQEGVPLVRLDRAFSYGLGLLIDDGLHPNSSGNQLIAEAFYEILK